MAKAAIRNLKMRRFWRWLCVEVYNKPEPKQPIKLNRKRQKINWRKFHRQCDKSFKNVFLPMLEKWKRENPQ